MQRYGNLINFIFIIIIAEKSPDSKPIKYHICHVCGYKSSVKSNLKKHVSNKHGEAELENMGVVEYGEPPKYHNCHICSYKSSFKQNLKKHIVTQHGEDELQNMEVMDYDGEEPTTLAKTKIIYPKNVGAKVAMNFT